jgi:hypothetical protein
MNNYLKGEAMHVLYYLKCECGAEKVYGINCQLWLHADWCLCFKCREECDLEAAMENAQRDS